jgi:hypothetical protein
MAAGINVQKPLMCKPFLSPLSIPPVSHPPTACSYAFRQFMWEGLTVFVPACFEGKLLRKASSRWTRLPPIYVTRHNDLRKHRTSRGVALLI